MRRHVLRKAPSLFTILLALGAGTPLFSAGIDIQHVAEIGSADDHLSGLASNFTVFNNELYFATAGRNGYTLSKTDGASVTKLAFDFHGFPAEAREYGGDLYLFELGGSHRLLKTDGESVTDLGVQHWTSNMIEYNGELYFGAVGANGNELYKTDGQALVEFDINPDGDSIPRGFREFQGELYFGAVGPNGHELYKTDGSSVTEFDINPTGDSTPWLGAGIEYQGSLYFNASGPNGNELFRTDGVSVVEAADINLAGDSTPQGMTVFQGEMFFSARGPNGIELFKTNGNTVTEFDINPAGDSIPYAHNEFRGELYITASDASGFRLFKTDGKVMTPLDIYPYPGEGHFAAFKEQLYYVSNNGTSGWELSKTDGTSVTTFDINPTGDSYPNSPWEFDGELYFRATGADEKRVLMRTDGTTLAAVEESLPFRFFSDVIEFQGHLLFVAKQSCRGRELYTTDGVTVTDIANINPFGDSNPEAFTLVGDELFFRATGPEGQSLYRMILVEDHSENQREQPRCDYPLSPLPGGAIGDDRVSVVYDPNTGELAVDTPEGRELTSLSVTSWANVFTREPAQHVTGIFDIDSDETIFKAVFGGSFQSISFGNVAQTGLSEEFLLNDLIISGSMAGGGGLGFVDLAYAHNGHISVPEPSTIFLVVISLVGLFWPCPGMVTVR
jgi:ELWxxDGT repeat protein